MVGSGGSLIGSRCGTEIDAHVAILRSNNAIVNETYAPDVGSRMTMMGLNDLFTGELLGGAATISNQIGNRDPSNSRSHTADYNGTDVVSFLEDKAHPGKNAFVRQFLSAFSSVTKAVTGVTSKNLGKKRTDIQRKYHAGRIFAASSDFLAAFTSWATKLNYQSDMGLQFPSTGFRTFALAMSLCDQVDVYGFTDELPGQPYHCPPLTVPKRPRTAA